VRAPRPLRVARENGRRLWPCLDRLPGVLHVFLPVVTCATNGWASFDLAYGFVTTPAGRSTREARISRAFASTARAQA